MATTTPELRLEWCSYEAARYAVEHWHYSRSLPTPPLIRVGVREDGKFIGCVLFGRGASSHLGKPYKLKQTECCELTRVALTKHATPVSRIVALAIKFLRKRSPGLRLIVSFADPEHGHHGGIYQAGNWIYTGQTPPSEKFISPDGRAWHGRQVTSTGISVQYGSRRYAPKRSECVRIELRGKYRYLFPLDAAMRAAVEKLRQIPPMRAGSIVANALADQAREGGANPTPALQSEKAGNS